MPTVQLPRLATLEQAPDLALELRASLAQGDGALGVDLSGVEAFDTSTIALLLQAQRLASAEGRGLEIIAPPAKLCELARLYGVGELLSLASVARSDPA